MNRRPRLERIEKQIAAYASNGVPDELSELRRRMFNPTPQQQRDAVISILDTMPDEYCIKVVEELNAYYEAEEEPDSKPTPLTARVTSLAQLRIYECPRPLALPLEFCRAYAELEPGQWLDTWADTCEDCLFGHLVLCWDDGGQVKPKHRKLFDKCVLCGGKLGWQFLSPASRPCHDHVDSNHRKAISGYTGDIWKLWGAYED
jgi:hypothetical protein